MFDTLAKVKRAKAALRKGLDGINHIEAQVKTVEPTTTVKLEYLRLRQELIIDMLRAVYKELP